MVVYYKMEKNLINGNISGIKDVVLEELERIYEIKLGRDEFAVPALLEEMARISWDLNREISVFLSRSGNVLDVSVGGNDSVTLPHLRIRRGTLGLSGVRCIHTHPSGSPYLSGVDVGTLISSRLDSMAAVSVLDGKARSLCAGFMGDTLTETSMYGPFSVNRIPGAALMAEIERATVRVSELIALQETSDKSERAMLIGLNADEYSMQELALLAETAGAEVVSRDVQKRERDRGYYIGKGKARELSLKASALDADIAIFDNELTVTESKNLEEILGLRIIDRTTLILDIFAGRARTREGKLQVELAQLKYSLPRLSGEGINLSRLGGGIGTRGPGEKKLEIDRRRIRARMSELSDELKKVEEQRGLRRVGRDKSGIKTVALVGYTNAGKSTLLNALSGADVFTEDMLFATLDPITRRLELPGGSVALLTDTVGFIEKLPHDLVKAFRSTLEEAAQADLLLNIIDVSNPECERQTEVVRDVLASLGVGDKPIIDVYNKCDKYKDIKKSSAMFISAKTGEGLQELLEEIKRQLNKGMTEITLKLSYTEGDLLSQIRNNSEHVDVDYQGEYMVVSALMSREVAHRFMKRVNS